MVVILNPVLDGMKNLMISTESTIEILRLSPQNDITTPSPDEGENRHALPDSSPFKGEVRRGMGDLSEN